MNSTRKQPNPSLKSRKQPAATRIVYSPSPMHSYATRLKQAHGSTRPETHSCIPRSRRTLRQRATITSEQDSPRPLNGFAPHNDSSTPLLTLRERRQRWIRRRKPNYTISPRNTYSSPPNSTRRQDTPAKKTRP